MKVEGTVEIIMGRTLFPEPKNEQEGWIREKVQITLEGSADAILTVIQELKTNSSLLKSFNLH